MIHRRGKSIGDGVEYHPAEQDGASQPALDSGSNAMNPAVWGLVASIAAGWFAVRRSLRPAWVVLGVSGALLLWPALRLRDGIPSPAADLSQHAPWAEGGSSYGNAILTDVTYQIQPWLLYLRTEMRAGRLPFWNPYQYSGTPFWGNGQSAPLFPLHLLFVLLPVNLGFVLIPWLRFVAAGAGVWFLGRELGLRRPGALLAAVCFPLSGMMVSYESYPTGSALALVPWVLLATERLANGRGTWRSLAVGAGLQFLAGHPETSVHTALLAGLYLLSRGASRTIWVRFVAGWTAAATLGAVHLFPLAVLVLESSRWAAAGVARPLLVDVLLRQPLRLIFPHLYGEAATGSWWGPFNDVLTAVYVGAPVLVLAVGGLGRSRTDRRWRGVVVLLIFSAWTAYHLPGPFTVLSHIPLLRVVAHHRLLFGIELTLALLGGCGLDRWQSGRNARATAIGAALLIVFTAVAWVLFVNDWRTRGLLTEPLVRTLFIVGVSAALLGALALDAKRRRRLVPVVLLVVMVDLLAAHGNINPGLSLERLYPSTGAVRFVKVRSGRVAGLGSALRANAAMVYGLFDVRGDDTLNLSRYAHAWESISPGSDPIFFSPIESWQDPWLDRLGVRWVFAGPSEPAPVAGWRLAYAGRDARVYERPQALPIVRWEGGGVPRVVAATPGRWEIEWDAAGSGRLIVAETWERGWQARLDDRPVPVEMVDGLLIGVRTSPGRGRLTLSYRPTGLRTGAALSLATVSVLAASWLAAARRPQTRSESPIVT